MCLKIRPSSKTGRLKKQATREIKAAMISMMLSYNRLVLGLWEDEVEEGEVIPDHKVEGETSLVSKLGVIPGIVPSTGFTHDLVSCTLGRGGENP